VIARQTSMLWITLWIQEVIHALTVAPRGVIHALTVAPLRINGRTTNRYLYLSFITTPIVRDPVSGDNPAGCPPSPWSPTTSEK
jgi:hypothetical protein